MSNLTRLVLVIWLFVVLIITQSYTANLASLLTVQRLQPKFVDVHDLVRNRHYVGYQSSFVKELLIREMNFDESRLRSYSSPEKYHEALMKGSGNGGVDAIFDETPYLKLFLAKYCDKYTIIGPTYKTDGFAFAFPMRSPLVSYVSRAVLKVTQDKAKMDAIERKNFLSQQISSCQDTRISMDQDTRINTDLSLSVYSFGGLFIITGLTSLFALVAELLISNWHHFSSSASRFHLVWSNFFMETLAKKPGLICSSLGTSESNTSRVVALTSS
ncbi:hypothetical protein CDL15_Pgr017667 [Punica granatum]|nr:hypothetical protein CDL15_Pgr017667 [Punica granatum]